MAGSQADRVERRRELFFPRGLGAPTRAHLWLRGYLDALRGRVLISGDGYVTSSFCQRLVQDADLRINAEWQECNGAMFSLRPSLENAIRECDEVMRCIDQLSERKAKRMNDAVIDRRGDDAVSEHLACKRRSRRIAFIENEFAATEGRLRRDLARAQAVISSILAEYQDARDISETHERLVRLDYVARLSCYSRGASRRVIIEAAQINDAALTVQPREENDELFGGSMRAALKRSDAVQEKGE